MQQPIHKLHQHFAALALLALSTFNVHLSTARAQGTAFSYQGRLNTAGAPGNGIYDLQFAIYDSLTNGNIVAGPLTNSAIGVSNGLFAVLLDFGPGVFTGANRWLEIGVSASGANAFVTLAPRQQILAAPYALMAASASNLVGGANLSGTFSGDGSGLTNLSAAALPTNVALLNHSQTFSGSNYFSGSVGIGTTSPAYRLSLGVDNATTKLAVWDGGPGLDMGFGVAPARFLFHLPEADNRFSFLNAPTGTEVMTIQGSGNVGIGTNNPQSTLHVAGDARISGLLYSGSQTGSAETPLVYYASGAVSPAGLVVRRINSTGTLTTPPPLLSVVAVCRNYDDTGDIQLVRDGTYGGFLITFPPTSSAYTIACMGMDDTGAQKNFYTLLDPTTAGSVQIYSDSQNIVHFECTFGDTFNNGHQTQVTLTRLSGDYYWSGSVISTYNQ
jgi:hypothetical protein